MLKKQSESGSLSPLSKGYAETLRELEGYNHAHSIGTLAQIDKGSGRMLRVLEKTISDFLSSTGLALDHESNRPVPLMLKIDEADRFLEFFLTLNPYQISKSQAEKLAFIIKEAIIKAGNEGTETSDLLCVRVESINKKLCTLGLETHFVLNRLKEYEIQIQRQTLNDFLRLQFALIPPDSGGPDCWANDPEIKSDQFEAKWESYLTRLEQVKETSKAGDLIQKALENLISQAESSIECMKSDCLEHGDEAVKYFTPYLATAEKALARLKGVQTA